MRLHCGDQAEVKAKMQLHLGLGCMQPRPRPQLRLQPTPKPRCPPSRALTCRGLSERGDSHRWTRAFFMRSKSSRHLLSIVEAVTCECEPSL